MLNFNSREFFQNPYATYAHLRANGPVWLPLNEDYESLGVWLFGSHADALRIFKEVKLTSKLVRQTKYPDKRNPFDLHLLNRDGSDHLRLRQLSNAAFSSKSLLNIEPFIISVVDDLYASINHGSNQVIDLLSDFCSVLPVEVIAYLMGLPRKDKHFFRKWAKAVFIDSLNLDEIQKQKRQEALLEMNQYFSWILESPDHKIDEGLLKQYLIAFHQGVISKDEFLAMAAFMLLAGHETTIDLLGNGFWLLKNHPEQLHRLIDCPQMYASTIEEVLRYESPNQRSTYRIVNEAIEISGQVMLPGNQIAVFIGSANRDEEVFKDADNFDIERQFNPHLAFGSGTHVCQGRALAKLEALIAFKKMAPLLLQSELLDHTASWKHNSFLRGLSSLNIRLK